MSSQWVAFFAGSFLGCIIGMGVLALCVVAGQSDRDLDRMQPRRGADHAADL